MARRKKHPFVWAGIGLAAVVACVALYSIFSPEPRGPAIQSGGEFQRITQAPTSIGNAGGAGQFGYTPRPDKTAAFVATLPGRSLSIAAPGLFRDDDKTQILLYRPMAKAYQRKYGKPFIVGQQGIGDCVSWGYKHGVDITLAVDCELGLVPKESWIEAATESIYGGSRVEAHGGPPPQGGWGDGSYGGGASKFLHDFGVCFRQDYSEFGFDLSVYSSKRAKDWGNYGNGGQNDNGRFDSEAKKHPVRNVALVVNFEEAAAAIKSGYPVPVCSGQGFSSQRDSAGFSRPSGSWSHCMCFVGVRYDRPGLLCLNSWGPSWVSGPKWPDDQPEGSFWVDAQVATRMLSGRDSFALAGVGGFKWRDLKHGEWVHYDKPGARFDAPALVLQRSLGDKPGSTSYDARAILLFGLRQNDLPSFLGVHNAN